MNDKPEIPSEGMEQARAETPRTDGTPTVNMGNYSPPPPPPSPPSYSQAPAPSQPPQYGYDIPPQGYTPPPGPGYGQGQPGAPTINTGGPPVYQPGQYGGGYQPTQPPPTYGYGYAVAPPKDPTMGLLLELIGFFGFLGIGHIWAGKTTRGIALLLGFWFYLAVSWFMLLFLVGCLMLIAAIFIPIASGLYLKSEMEREQAAMGIRR